MKVARIKRPGGKTLLYVFAPHGIVVFPDDVALLRYGLSCDPTLSEYTWKTTRSTMRHLKEWIGPGRYKLEVLHV